MDNSEGAGVDIANLIERIHQHRFNGYTENMIAAEIDKFRSGVGTNSIGAAVDALKSVARSLESTDSTLREQLAKLGVDWQGKAAERAGATLGERAGFSGAANATIDHAAEMIFAQGEAFNRTRNKLPDAKTITDGAGGASLGDAVLSLIGFETDHATAVSHAREAKQQAVEVLNEYARHSGENLARAQSLPDPGSQPGGGGQTEPIGSGMRPIMPAPTPTGGGLDPLLTGEPTWAGSAPAAAGPPSAAPPPAPTAPSTVPDVPAPPAEAPAPGAGTGSSRPAPEHTAPSGAPAGAAAPSQSGAVGGVIGGVVGGARPGRGNSSSGRFAGGASQAPSGSLPPSPGSAAGGVVGGLPGAAAPTSTPGAGSPGKPGGTVAGKPDPTSAGAPGAGGGRPIAGSPGAGQPGPGAPGSGQGSPGGAGGGQLGPGSPGSGSADEPLGKGKTLGSMPVPPSSGNAAGSTSVSVPKPGPSVNDLGAGATAVGAGGAAGAMSGEPERRGRGVGKSAPHAGTSQDSLPLDAPGHQDADQLHTSETARAEQDGSPSGLLEPAAPAGGDALSERVRNYGIDDNDLFTDQRMVGPSVLGDSGPEHTG